MRTPETTPRLGTGTAVTMTRKNSTVAHDPAPTTERGKRRAAIRRRRLHVAALSEAKRLEEMNV